MAKKKKKMSNAKAAKTIVSETVKTLVKKAKIGSRKRTVKQIKRSKAGKAVTLKDSARLAAAKARRKKKK